MLRSLALATLVFASAVTAPDTGAVADRRPASTNGLARLPHVVPESVGMSATRLARIDEVVSRGISAGGFPGAAVVVGRHGAIVWERGYGSLDWQSGARVDAEHTMYDLASLTKVVATTAAAMVLVDRGKLRLDERVTHYLPAFSGGGKDAVTIRDLLMHRSGLPAGRDLPGRGDRSEAARRAVLATPLVRPPDSVTEPGWWTRGVVNTARRAASDPACRRGRSRPAGSPDRCMSRSRIVTASLPPPVNAGR